MCLFCVCFAVEAKLPIGAKSKLISTLSPIKFESRPDLSRLETKSLIFPNAVIKILEFLCWKERTKYSYKFDAIKLSKGKLKVDRNQAERDSSF